MITQILMEITDSTFVAPGLSLSAFAGLLALAAREYKSARQIDVEGERNRRVAAETREQQSDTVNAVQIEELTKKINDLEKVINQLRADREKDLLQEREKNFRLRKLLTDHGVPYPEELGPT